MSPFQCLHLAFLKLRICSFTCVYVRNQLCLTLCDPMDYSLPGSSVHGIFPARILEWVAFFFIYILSKFSLMSYWVIEQMAYILSSSCLVTKSCLTLCNPWTAAHQASLSFTISWSLLKFMSIQSVMPFNHFIFCHPLLLLPSIFPGIGSFPVSWLFASGGQSIRALASASVLPVSFQG